MLKNDIDAWIRYNELVFLKKTEDITGWHDIYSLYKMYVFSVYDEQFDWWHKVDIFFWQKLGKVIAQFHFFF